jgi:hypothetical protein
MKGRIVEVVKEATGIIGVEDSSRVIFTERSPLLQVGRKVGPASKHPSSSFNLNRCHIRLTSCKVNLGIKVGQAWVSQTQA